jgi:thiosulfate/3-mercaptopyruvate sulfurtransferase
MLKYYGHKNVKVLDGGWQGWVDAGYPVSYKKPAASGNTNIKPTANPHLLVELNDIRENYTNKNWQILDVRSDDEYSGRAAHGNSKEQFTWNGTGL